MFILALNECHIGGQCKAINITTGILLVDSMTGPLNALELQETEMQPNR